MKIEAICVDNSNFEDSLTTGRAYPILELCPHGSGVKIKDDRGRVVDRGLINLKLREVPNP